LLISGLNPDWKKVDLYELKLNIMNKIFLTLFFMGLLFQLNSQNDLWLISPYGTDFRDNNFMVSASAGEPLIETFRTNEFIFTQGFHQSFDGDGTYTTEINSDLVLSIYPNPFMDIIVLQSDLENTIQGELFDLKIYDILGRTHYVDILNPGFEPRKTINTSEWISGIYFLQISERSKAAATKTFKLIKN